MGAELLELIPVFSMGQQAIQVEVPALQFDLRSTAFALTDSLSQIIGIGVVIGALPAI